MLLRRREMNIRDLFSVVTDNFNHVYGIYFGSTHRFSSTLVFVFWLIWYNTKRVYTILLCLLASLALSLVSSLSLAFSLSVHNPPSHSSKHRNIHFDAHVYIKYFVILTYIFEMATILVLFLDLTSSLYVWS